MQFVVPAIFQVADFTSSIASVPTGCNLKSMGYKYRKMENGTTIDNRLDYTFPYLVL